MILFNSSEKYTGLWLGIVHMVNDKRGEWSDYISAVPFDVQYLKLNNHRTIIDYLSYPTDGHRFHTDEVENLLDVTSIEWASRDLNGSAVSCSPLMIDDTQFIYNFVDENFDPGDYEKIQKVVISQLHYYSTIDTQNNALRKHVKALSNEALGRMRALGYLA